MKKLRNKVYVTILFILTIFQIVFCLFFNVSIYKKEKDTLDNNIKMLSSIDDDTYQNENNIFLDYNVYTVLLTDNNEILGIISHNYNTKVDNSIVKIAKMIIRTKDIKKANNLYFDRYLYYFKDGSYITIIDNYKHQQKLILSLEVSILLFLFFEVIVLYLSKLITDYIIEPAYESYNKQKEFIEDASHELKTPLSVILASCEAYETFKDKKYLDTIKDETLKMNKLVCDLLDLSKLEDEDVKKTFTNVNLSKLVTKQILTFEPLAFEKNITFEDLVQDNINIYCNSEDIQSLIEIIIDNAISHSYKNNKITVSLNSSKDNVILKITNAGEPIKKEEEDKIFERFYRSDKSRNRNESRYGLGLAIAKRIVLNHNGSIKASSKNCFTTFTIILPKNKSI